MVKLYLSCIYLLFVETVFPFSGFFDKWAYFQKKWSVPLIKLSEEHLFIIGFFCNSVKVVTFIFDQLNAHLQNKNIN